METYKIPESDQYQYEGFEALEEYLKMPPEKPWNMLEELAKITAQGGVDNDSNDTDHSSHSGDPVVELILNGKRRRFGTQNSREAWYAKHCKYFFYYSTHFQDDIRTLFLFSRKINN
jgi:hypothetical protein